MQETTETDTKTSQDHVRGSDARCLNCKGEGFDYSKEPEFESDTPQCLRCMGSGLVDDLTQEEIANEFKRRLELECELMRCSVQAQPLTKANMTKIVGTVYHEMIAENMMKPETQMIDIGKIHFEQEKRNLNIELIFKGQE
jgi:hypothetical protein